MEKVLSKVVLLVFGVDERDIPKKYEPTLAHNMNETTKHNLFAFEKTISKIMFNYTGHEAIVHFMYGRHWAHEVTVTVLACPGKFNIRNVFEDIAREFSGFLGNHFSVTVQNSDSEQAIFLDSIVKMEHSKWPSRRFSPDSVYALHRE